MNTMKISPILCALLMVLKIASGGFLHGNHHGIVSPPVATSSLITTRVFHAGPAIAGYTRSTAGGAGAGVVVGAGTGTGINVGAGHGTGVGAGTGAGVGAGASYGTGSNTGGSSVTTYGYSTGAVVPALSTTSFNYNAAGAPGNQAGSNVGYGYIPSYGHNSY